LNPSLILVLWITKKLEENMSLVES
jgi:hypothetical protein